MQRSNVTSDANNVVIPSRGSTLNLQPISEEDSALIHGGKHDQRHGLDRPKERLPNPWWGDKFLSQGFGNGLVINIYQINLAINTILGGSGNSIVNVQANSSANA